MFIDVFATFFALMTLYNTTSSNNTYQYLRSETRSVSPMTIVTTENVYATHYSGTSVTFEFAQTNLSKIYTETSNRQVNCYYYFKYDFENNRSAGALQTYMYKEDGAYKLRINSNPSERFNLKCNIMVEWLKVSTGDYEMDATTFSYNFSKQNGWVYTFSNEIFTEDYFTYPQNYMYITIETVPMNEEEWSGTWEEGWEEGYTQGYNEGNQDGYSEGYNNAIDQGSTAATIFSGIVTVGLLPVNFFLGILNFEVFGINIGAFVSALLTVAIVIIIIKMFTGGGGAKDD